MIRWLKVLLQKLRHPEVNSLEWVIKDLRRLMEWAAADPDSQVEMYRRHYKNRSNVRILPDELANDWNDICLLLPQLVQQGLLPPERANAVLELDRHFEKMSSRHDEYLWTLDAMRRDEDWEQVRDKARGMLEDFGWGPNTG